DWHLDVIGLFVGMAASAGTFFWWTWRRYRLVLRSQNQEHRMPSLGGRLLLTLALIFLVGGIVVLWNMLFR
ncbi:MAG: hypothetical protein O2995_10830, partial [Proteobacteria bacterium]|nr:hypothetical protein [Pseudomonadota bacterium]